MLPQLIGTIVGSVVSLLGDGVKQLSEWDKRRSKLQEAKLNTQLAIETAKADLAVYQVKADMEWDLKWADQAAKSWKDEFMLIIWAIPLIGLFIPPMRPYVQEGFTYLSQFHPEAATWYMTGWAIIFAAVYGIKAAAQYMLPGRIGTLATALGKLPDDVPDDQAASAFLDRKRG
jgi:hypothetical protein